MSADQPADRTLRAALVGGALLLQERESRAASGRLLVFLHLPLKQRALEKVLGDTVPGVEITAVGRIADLNRALKSGQDAVLSLPIVLAAKGVPSQLQGVRGGKTDEPYVLVAADRVPDPAQVNSVAAIDILGRSGTQSFVRALLGGGPKVVRVTKIEDLLAVLQMRRAEAILLPERLTSDLREMSALNLVQRRLDVRVALPAVGATGPLANEVMTAVNRMPARTKRLLGVDEWR